MEREERLRAAKEKLKKFQKKKQEGHSTTPSDLVTENESCRSTPGDHDVHTNLESGVDAFETRQSHTSSSVSDQIEQVLSASSARRLSDLTSDDIELSKIRIGQLEREKLELATANHQFRSSIQALENNLSEAKTEVEQLQTKLEDANIEHQNYITNETQKSQSQIESHAESIQILVAEKTELEAVTAKLQRELKDAQDEVHRVKNNRPVNSKEKTCACTDRVFLAEVERKRLSDQVAILRDERDRLKIEVIDYKQEVLECRSKADYHEKGSILLAQQLKESNTKLELAEVNLSQLRASTNEDEKESEDKKSSEIEEKNRELSSMLSEKESEMNRISSENEEHVKRVAELTAYIQQASQDREQIIQQYTTYSQQLANQIETLTQQLHVKANENHKFAVREADLVAHVERLEGQLQKSMKDSTSEKMPISNENELAILRSQMMEGDKKALDLQLERDKLQESLDAMTAKCHEQQMKLKDDENKLAELETKLEMAKDQSSLEELKQNESLIAASTSDKVAASRAMKQNQDLKRQVEELENAVIQVTNTKAQMMTELDESIVKLRKLEESETSTQSLVTGLQNSIKERDRSIKGLKEQVKYYAAFAEQSAIQGGHPPDAEFISQLQDAKEKLENLTMENVELKNKLARESTSDSSHLENGDSSDSSSSESSIIETVKVEFDDKNNNASNEASPVISKDVAMLKMEQKLKQAMEKVADLSSEKEHLEHTIVRLQDETDTVGEYITIYQYQRAQQKAQMQEKDEYIHSIARDREELKQKLAQLQGLLNKYLGPNEIPEVPVEVAKEAESINGHKEHTDQETAGQILSLLSEIGSNEMLTCDKEKFEPWFWEPSAGRLMTV